MVPGQAPGKPLGSVDLTSHHREQGGEEGAAADPTLLGRLAEADLAFDDPEDPRDHEAFQRKFERDKAELRDLGVPLETGTASVFDQEPGYRIAHREYALPDIILEPDEAAAVKSRTSAAAMSTAA